jgi:hypothetical protein
MGIRRGPNIIQEGLVLSLDAGNIRSYPGSGTAWRNLAGPSGNATLTNGAAYANPNKGVMEFDGSNDYTTMVSPGSYSEYTFSFYCKWLTSVTYNRIFGLDNFGTYTVFSPNNVGFHYNPLGGSPPSVTLSSGVDVGFGTWCEVAVTVSAASTSVIIYINGISRNSWTTLPSGNLSGNIYLGAQNTSGLTSNCHIGNFKLYNRALTATEILQNFDMTKTRFGL